METKAIYSSPLGMIAIQTTERGISSLKFIEQGTVNVIPDNPFIKDTIAWLYTYFAGQRPSKIPSLDLHGTTFQKRVWHSLLAIPYGQVRTYGQLAQQLASSPRAVGNAVGKNPVLLIIPCHRVVGQDGRLTGYSGGLERKRQLLAMEKAS